MENYFTAHWREKSFDLAKSPICLKQGGTTLHIKEEGGVEHDIYITDAELNWRTNYLLEMGRLETFRQGQKDKPTQKKAGFHHNQNTADILCTWSVRVDVMLVHD